MSRSSNELYNPKLVGQGFTSCIFRITNKQSSSKSRKSTSTKIARLTYKTKLDYNYSQDRINIIRKIPNFARYTTGIPKIISHISLTSSLKKEIAKCTKPDFPTHLITDPNTFKNTFAATLAPDAGNYTLREFSQICNESNYISISEFNDLIENGIKSFQKNGIVHSDIHEENIMLSFTTNSRSKSRKNSPYHNLKIIDWDGWWSARFSRSLIDRFAISNLLKWKTSPQLRVIGYLFTL
jgi:hypothetical protein